MRRARGTGSATLCAATLCAGKRRRTTAGEEQKIRSRLAGWSGNAEER